MVMHKIRERDEQGISESIGFMLIFTLIIVGIGLVTLYGYPLLLEQQVNADTRIMEKNMIVIQNDIKSLTYKSVPYKETSLKIGGGMLTVYNTTANPTPSFIISDLNGPIAVFNPGQLQYESVSAQQVIAIENGAVITRPIYQPGSVMLAEPRWFSDTDPITSKTTTVIYLIGINSTDILSRTGVGTVQMQLQQDMTNYTEVSAPSNPIIVTYTPDPANDFSDAWRNYITISLNWVETAPNTYQLPTSDTLIIKKYDIMVKGL
ncbi:MAG: hypothetical protein OS112_00855 [Methanoregula sp.]|nr:MAG: hypothetical protein OS112_00855 [Methanoregula sp.]